MATPRINGGQPKTPLARPVKERGILDLLYCNTSTLDYSHWMTSRRVWGRKA